MSFDRARAAALQIANGRAALKAQELRTEIVANLSQPGRGREYQRRTVTHRASAPGDGPAVDTGRLRQSIGVQQLGEGRYRVGTNVQYAPLLEFGTRTTAPRPFMRPAAQKVKNRG